MTWVGLADQTLDSELQEIFDIHLKTCRRCREDLGHFLRFRKTGLLTQWGWNGGGI
jgi:hypothetical protein